MDKVYGLQYRYYSEGYSYSSWEEYVEADFGVYTKREAAQERVDVLNANNVAEWHKENQSRVDRNLARDVRMQEQERKNKVLAENGFPVETIQKVPDKAVLTYEEWVAWFRPSYYEVIELDVN